MPYREVGDIDEVKGLGRVMRVPGRYDYVNAPTRCPNCQDDAAGVPWLGWFFCDYACSFVALVETGECFVQLGEKFFVEIPRRER